MRGRLRLAALGLVAVVVVWLVARQPRDAAGSLPGGDAQLAAPETRDETATALPETRTVARRSALAELALDIRRGDGRPVTGHLYWTTLGQPSWVGSLLAPEHGAASLPPDTRRTQHSGTATLRLDPEATTWVCITSAGPPFLSRYERIEPFSGRRHELIELDRARALHVFAVENDVVTPARHERLRLYASDLRSGGPPALLREVSTGDGGYVAIRKLPPGGYVVCGQQVSVREAPPYVRMVVLSELVPMQEIPCRIVIPERRVGVKLRVSTGATKKLSARLFLARQRQGFGEVYPVRVPLVPGVQDIAVRVPPGSYRVGVLPLGQFDVSGDVGLDVGNAAARPRRFSVMLTTRQADTEIELRGLTGDRLPVTVLLRPADASLDYDPELMFHGPYRWTVASCRIAVRPGRKVVEARGRAGRWVSRRVVDVQPGKVAVELVPATRLDVRWSGRLARTETEAAVVLTTRLDTVMIPLHQSLRSRKGRHAPGREGSVLVPRGRVEVSCERICDGHVLWTRSVDAVDPVQSLRVDQTGAAGC